MLQNSKFKILATLSVILGLACILVIFMQINNITTAKNNRKMEKAIEKRLDSLFTGMYDDNQPGAAILILKGDKIIYDKGYGVANYDTNLKIDGNTFFNIASVSKQFSAIAIMKLTDEGKISLDDPISKFFPEFKAPFFKEITLKHILSQSSGIPDKRPRTDRDFVLYATDVDSYAFMEDLDKLNFEPGTNYEYVNPTFQLIYTIVERVTGVPFEQYMRNEVFAPAHMDKTLYFAAGRDIPNMAHGYQRDKNGVWQEYDYGEENFFATKADGGIYSSTHEFMNWEKALRKNAIVKPESLKEAHTPHTDVSGSTFSSYQKRPYTSYGYGWFIEEDPDKPLKIYHTGDNGGFQIYAGRYPEEDILILIFENRNDYSRWGTVTNVEKILFPLGVRSTEGIL